MWVCCWKGIAKMFVHPKISNYYIGNIEIKIKEVWMKEYPEVRP